MPSIAPHRRAEDVAALAPSDAESQRTGQAVWSCIDGLDPATRDLACALLAEAQAAAEGHAPRHHLLENVHVTANRLLARKTVNRWFRAPADPNAWLGERMRDLRGVNFDRYLLRNGSPRAREWQYVHDRLFQIVEVRSSNGGGGQNSTGWLMRGGQWSAWQTNARGRLLLCRLGLASLYLPKTNDLRFAVKLAFYLAFVVLRNDRPTPLSCVIGPLLEAIGELPQAGTKTAGWTRLVVQRFNKAMRALDQARVIAVRRLPRQSEFRHVRGEAAQLRAWLASHVEIASAVTVAEVDG